jgi:delta 1-pyrroline-5-carboxylate dehydrogenase
VTTYWWSLDLNALRYFGADFNQIAINYYVLKKLHVLLSCLSLYIFQIFGPVQSIIKFTDINDVIERANNSKYGLAAGVMTKDINKALMMSQNLEAGSVWYR